MNTQFVWNVLSKLPQIIQAAEVLFPQPGAGAQKKATVEEELAKVEGAAASNSAVAVARQQAIDAQVAYANILAAAERALGTPKVAPPPVILTSPNLTPQPPTPPVVSEEEITARAAAVEAHRAKVATVNEIGTVFGFLPDEGHATAYLAGTTSLAEFLADMVERNGRVVPANLPATYRALLPPDPH